MGMMDRFKGEAGKLMAGKKGGKSHDKGGRGGGRSQQGQGRGQEQGQGMDDKRREMQDRGKDEAKNRFEH